MNPNDQRPDDQHAPARHPSGATAAPAPAPAPSRRRVPLIVAAVVVVALLAAAVWALTAGPLSSSAREKRHVEDAVQSLGSSSGFADFNSRMCEQYRMPQEMVDTIVTTGRQTGQDVDALFRDQAMSKFPKDLKVDEVTVDGDEAQAQVASEQGGSDETVHLRREGGDWKLCEPGVGMGSVKN